MISNVKYILLLLVLLSTTLNGQKMLTYQVAYSDDSLLVTNTGWSLSKQPVAVTTTGSRIVTDSTVDNFMNSNYIMIHAGKNHYYSLSNNINNYCGFSELSQSYQLKERAVSGFFDMEITDSLKSNFGNYSFTRTVTPREKGIFQIGGIQYDNIQCIETRESIALSEEQKLKKSRLIKSFYQSGADFPMIEFISDTLNMDTTQRVIEFILYDNKIMTEVISPPKNRLTIFPNPTKDIIHVQTDDIESGIITIVSLTGEKIYETIARDTITSIDVSTLAVGMYVLRYQNKYKTKNSSLIKL